jgi:DNA-binding CsgD family transcriptional regulator
MKIGSSPNPGSFLDTPALVGRAVEQRLLREDLAAAGTGRGGLVVVSGEAGIGKTALASDLVAEAVVQQVCVLTGNCYDLTVTPPYGPWLGLAASYRPTADMPALPYAFETGRIEEIANQAALFSDVREFFATLSAGRPVLIVLEDLHWADPASLELLRYLGAGISAQGMLMLVTYRRDELTRTHPFYQQFPALIRESGGRRLDLHPLDTTDLRALVAAQYPMPISDEDRLVSYLECHAEGNPFFTAELLRSLVETGLLRTTRKGWALDELNRIVMPSLVQQVIDGRISRLGDEMRQPLSVAAVIGQDVRLDLWTRVLGLDPEALLSIVERAIEAHLLDATQDGTRVHFVHALTREALYEGIVPPRRRLVHLRVGEMLAAEPNGNPDAVAFHFQQGGDSRAWEWYVRAGERAQRAYAWLMAKERFATAAALLDSVAGEEERRARLLYRCGRLQRYADTVDGIANLAAAERVAILAGSRVLAADAKYSRGLLRCFADDFGPGMVEMESGIIELENLPADEAEESWGRVAWMADALPPRELADVPDADLGARALIEAGVHHRRGSLPWFLAAAGYLARAETMAEQFVALTGDLPARELVISATGHAYFGLALAHAARGCPAEAQRAFARARAIYGQIEHHAVIGFTHLNELRDVVLPYFTTQLAGRRQLAEAAETALNLAAGAFPSDRSSRRARLGLLFLEGKWDEAISIANEVESHGNYALRREVTNSLAPIWYWQDRTDLVQRQIQMLLPQGPAAEPGGVVFLDGLLLQRLAADLALDRGDLSAALSWIEANDRWLDWSGAVLGRAENQMSWARYCRQSGDLRRAARYLDAAVEAASNPRQPLALLAAHRSRGELATGTERLEDANRDLQQALTLGDLCATPFERALTLQARAVLRVALDRPDEANSDLSEARAILTSLNAHRALRRGGGVASRHGGPDGGAPGGLTHRELEVLRLVAQGLTDAEVADRLFISPRTVGQHLRSVYSKLDVSSRVAATRYAIDHDLV